MSKNRQPVKPLNQSPDHVKASAAAEKARKAQSKAALAAERAKAAAEAVQSKAPESKPAAPEVDPAVEQSRREVEARDTLVAQRVDFDALCEADSDDVRNLSFREYLEKQGFDEQGFALKQAKTPYSGPMLALKAARKTYVKAANGIQCNGSPLAMLCGQYKREVVVAALIDALKLPGNPYSHLNPGQQSMNLRNKARHQMSEGHLSMGEVEACLKAHAVKA